MMSRTQNDLLWIGLPKRSALYFAEYISVILLEQMHTVLAGDQWWPFFVTFCA